MKKILFIVSFISISNPLFSNSSKIANGFKNPEVENFLKYVAFPVALSTFVGVITAKISANAIEKRLVEQLEKAITDAQEKTQS